MKYLDTPTVQLRKEYSKPPILCFDCLWSKYRRAGIIWVLPSLFSNKRWEMKFLAKTKPGNGVTDSKRKEQETGYRVLEASWSPQWGSLWSHVLTILEVRVGNYVWTTLSSMSSLESTHVWTRSTVNLDLVNFTLVSETIQDSSSISKYFESIM